MPTGYFSSNDPFSFSNTYLSASSLFQSGLSIQGQPAAGNLWVNLPRATFEKCKGGKPLVFDRKELSKADADKFARFFRMQSNSAQIPWILGPASAIPVVGTVITIVTSTIDGLQRLSQPPVNSDQLAIVMAEGGSFTRTIAEEPPTRVTTTVFYNVNVGKEGRSYGICSATYGLNVVG